MAGDTTTTRPATFRKGTNAATFELSYPAGIGSTIMPMAHIGVHRFIFDNFSLGAEVVAAGIWQPGDDAAAVGVIGMFRHHLIQNDRASFFMDFGFGPLQASDRVPEGGTDFNFITRVGPGVAWRLDDKTSLVGTARYWHLSNARIEGHDRNPSLNAAELSIGLMWKW